MLNKDNKCKLKFEIAWIYSLAKYHHQIKTLQYLHFICALSLKKQIVVGRGKYLNLLSLFLSEMNPVEFSAIHCCY